MLNIINSAALHCVVFGVSVLLNDFLAMAMEGKWGVPCCICCQADQGVLIWRSGAHLPHFSYVSLYGAEPLLYYLCTACLNSSVDTIVMLVSSIVIITSTLRCGHDEWCVMIISVWCVFHKLLRPSWISKYIMKTGCNSITVGCKGRWLFCHHRRTTRLWWSRRPSPPLFIWCGRGQ